MGGDAFSGFPSADVGDPVTNAAVVTPSDTADLATPARAVYIGTGGDVSLDTVGGESAIVFVGLQTGSILPVRTKRIRATATTATNIVALW